MSGLSYICEYSDVEDYQSEEDILEIRHEKTDEKIHKLPRPNLSKIPVVSINEEQVDDPELHNGRIRNFPHVRGNWATFVYIEYPKKENLFKLINKLEVIIATIDNSYCKLEDIHISLTKTFVLNYHMINTFVASLQEILNKVESFELGFESVEVYCNEEKTRTFIALKVDFFAHRYLIDVTKKIDSILEDFRLPQFYQKPSFHMSILSFDGDKKQDVDKLLNQLNQQFDCQEERLESIVISKVNCKSGNKYFQYNLK